MPSRIPVALLFSLALAHSATVYEIGPGQKIKTIGKGPWMKLKAGDQVLIHWREEPYREKFVVAGRGKADAPILVKGIPNDKGDLPVIEASGATTSPNFEFDNEDRSIIKVGGATWPSTEYSSYIEIDGFELRGARSGIFFTNAKGGRGAYEYNAAGVHIERATNVTVRNCVIHDNGNGLFIGSTGERPTRNILIERNYIYDNGYSGDSQHHNSYAEAVMIVYQFNRYGPIKGDEKGDGQGNNLKDRSAGTVVRYNWIEGGNRQLDLVESGSPIIRQDPAYRASFVFGNVLIDHPGSDNNQIVNYGGDSHQDNISVYRTGKLYFYNNTVVSLRKDMATMFYLPHPDTSVDARNNVFYAPEGTNLYIAHRVGKVELANNWLRQDYQPFAEKERATGQVIDFEGNRAGPDPGFRNLDELDLAPAAGSALIGAATSLSEAIPEQWKVTLQYQKHRSSIPRGELLDLGALAPERSR